MIIKVGFKNFLSLRDCSIKLEKFNVLIGPNASGKSNFVKGLELVKNFVSRGVEGIKLTFPNLKFEDIIYGKTGDNFSISILLDSHNKRIRYEISFGIEYIKETMKVEDKIIFSRRSTVNNEVIRISQFRIPPSIREYFNVRIYFSRPLIRLVQYLPPEARDAVGYLANMSFFSFNPDAIRASSNVTKEPKLLKDGSNIGRVLLHLYLEERDKFSELEEIIRSLIPDVKEIIPKLRGNIVYIAAKDFKINKIIEPQLISDGTVRIIAIVTSLVISQSLVAYEEPENCVHPKLLESIVDLMKKLGRQIIITTHSPYLLDFVAPEDIILVRRINGETKLSRLIDRREIEAVKKLLEEGGTLGEAWYSGLMGE